MSSSRPTLPWIITMALLVAAAAIAVFSRGSLGNGTLAGLVATTIWLCIWILPKRQVERIKQNAETKGPLELENDYRQTLVQIVGGLAIFVTVYATFDNARLAHDTLRLSAQNLSLASQSFDLTRRGQVADRTFKAMDLLSKDNNMDARVAAVYSLEQVANEDSRSEWSITEILFNYARVHAKWYDSAHRGDDDPLSPDLSAITDYLRRRPWQTTNPDGTKSCNEYWQCGNYTGLRAKEDDPYYAWSINLPLVDFRNAFLEHAMLKGFIISNAHLEHSRLGWGTFDGAYAANAKFNSADLRCSHWREANMEHAVLDNAVLFGADFSGAFNLTQEQLDKAKGDGFTVLPNGISRPVNWIKASENKCQPQH